MTTEIDALLEEENEQEKEQLKLHLLDTINDICKEEGNEEGARD